MLNRLNRRDFVVTAGGGLTVLLGGCLTPDPLGGTIGDAAHLTARPKTPSGNAILGVRALGLGTDRDGFLYVPQGYVPAKPASVVVLMHGAGQSSALWSSIPMETFFGARNIILIAPDSRGESWDLRSTGFGPDVTFIDRALNLVFSQYEVDPAHIALGGFSDGASYALSLGATNGDLFTALIAFSPGFYSPDKLRGKPRIFISHGTGDPILPFENTSEQLVPKLRNNGYEVKFVQFDGGHTVTADISTQAMDWFVSAA